MKPTLYEPKMTNRFTVILPKEFDIEPYLIQSINKPKYDNVNKQWDNIEISFIDLVGPSVSYKLLTIINDILSVDSDYSFEFKIQDLDPTGIVIEEWIIAITKILSIDFGDNDHSIGNILQPKMILKPSFCRLFY
jgi:hypothetical protein